MLLFFCGCFRRLFSVKTSALNGPGVFDLLQYQHHAAYFSIRVLKIQIRGNVIHYFQANFSEVLIEDSNGRGDIYSFVLSFFGITIGPVVEVGESAARGWTFGTRG